MAGPRWTTCGCMNDAAKSMLWATTAAVWRRSSAYVCAYPSSAEAMAVSSRRSRTTWTARYPTRRTSWCYWHRRSGKTGGQGSSARTVARDCRFSLGRLWKGCQGRRWAASRSTFGELPCGSCRRHPDLSQGWCLVSGFQSCSLKTMDSWESMGCVSGSAGS
jgi:hypothetical protein